MLEQLIGFLKWLFAPRSWFKPQYPPKPYVPPTCDNCGDRIFGYCQKYVVRNSPNANIFAADDMPVDDLISDSPSKTTRIDTWCIRCVLNDPVKNERMRKELNDDYHARHAVAAARGQMP